MRVEGFEVAVDRHAVTVRQDGELVATARWTGRALRDREGSLRAATWDALEQAIVTDEAEALAASMASAHDEQGVDLTLIDWMLTLTPTERLRVLLRHASELSEFARDDLRE